jgi:hypothetical protein
LKTAALAVLALVVAVGGIWYFANKRMQFTPPDAGIPTYPGAKNINTDSFSSKLKPSDKARLIKAVIYETPDGSDKVIAFYKEQLKGKSQVFEKSFKGVPSAIIRTEVNGKPRIIKVTANEDTGKTEIAIGLFEEPKMPPGMQGNMPQPDHGAAPLTMPPGKAPEAAPAKAH